MLFHLTPGSRAYRDTYTLLHLIVLALSIYLVVSISIDTFRGVDFYAPRYLHTQFYICIAFIVVFFLELALSEKKWRFFRNNLLFLIVSVPYLDIFKIYDITFSPQVAYLVQYIPLVRGGYALAIVVGTFTYNRAASIFVTYLVTLMSTVYFGSLMFYLFENKVNEGVNSYTDSLWWALMDMTTVGSDIHPLTPPGKVIAVVLAALGMMMFPIFTVYITSLISHRRDRTDLDAALPGGTGHLLQTLAKERTADASATSDSPDVKT